MGVDWSILVSVTHYGSCVGYTLWFLCRLHTMDTYVTFRVFIHRISIYNINIHSRL